MLVHWTLSQMSQRMVPYTVATLPGSRNVHVSPQRRCLKHWMIPSRLLFAVRMSDMKFFNERAQEERFIFQIWRSMARYWFQKSGYESGVGHCQPAYWSSAAWNELPVDIREIKNLISVKLNIHQLLKWIWSRSSISCFPADKSFFLLFLCSYIAFNSHLQCILLATWALRLD